MKITESIKRVLCVSDFASEVFSRFIFADFAFTILPLAVIIFLRFLTGASLNDLLLIPEWSFATVIFSGLAITQIIKVKAMIQRDISYRLDMLTRTYTLFLIIAVIFLAVIVLKEQGLKTDDKVLLAMQFFLFFIAIFLFFMPHYARMLREYEKETLKVEIRKYYRFIKESLVEARENLIYIQYALEKKKNLKDSVFNSEVSRKSQEDEIKYLMDSIEKDIGIIKTIF